ncbi:hypothetical protein Kyoto57A_00010 [Helicobacter pylori]
MAKELEKKDKGFTIKLEELNKILQEINKRANDCCLGCKDPKHSNATSHKRCVKWG